MYLVLVAGVLYHAETFSQSQQEVELRLKAVYLLNFMKFTEWPDSAFQSVDDPIILHIVGKDPFGSILEETFESEKIYGRPIVVRRMPNGLGKEKCHLCFISSSEQNNVDHLLTQAKGNPTLMVSDIRGFALRDGMIGFYLEKDRIRFDINMRALDRAGIKMSSKILRLARIVKPI